MAAISKLVSRLPTASGSEQIQARSGAGGTCGQFFGRHFEFISIFVLWLRHGGGWWLSSRLMANDEDDKEVTADAVVVVVGPFCTLFRGQ